jgi:antitoxin ParD1/3/4
MTITISLPEGLRTWVEEQAAGGGYPSPADYVQHVLREAQQEQERQLRQEIERKLVAALDSGEPVEVNPEFWEARRQELKRRLERQSNAKE